MRQCWNFDAQSRPTFGEIVTTLDNIITTYWSVALNEEYLNLINDPYIDETSSVHSDEDRDFVDGFQGRPQYRPFLR